MRNKTIPILITVMIVALCGILFIQYLWIRKSITEKQALVDNKVVQAITNMDVQLSDFSTMALFTSVDSFNFNLSDTVLRLESIDSPFFESPYPVPVPVNMQSAQNMQIKIISRHDETDSNTISQTEIIRHQQIQADCMRVELEKIEDELYQLDEVRSVFDRIRFEVGPQMADLRLDSNRMASILKTELASFELDTLVNWGVYDKMDQDFVIEPNPETDFRYEIPLFKNDLVHPGRFILKLDLPNNTKLVWIDIRLMIFMSVLFMLIILTVFLYAVRLVIKHKKISQIKSDFINNMTHEFKTPLASISLAADSIVHPTILNDPTRIAAYVQIIHQEKSKLNQNVERILEVASLEKDAIILPAEKIDLSALIRESVKNLQLLIQHKNGTVSLNLVDNLFISGSSFHLTQALSNIIENGIKYSNEKPELTISLSRKDSTAEIQITDKGIGMNQEQLARVFDSFYRAETGNVHNTKGFGLGLTYARFIIEKMKGSIEIQSTPLQGTVVIIQFPLL